MRLARGAAAPPRPVSRHRGRWRRLCRGGSPRPPGPGTAPLCGAGGCPGGLSASLRHRRHRRGRDPVTWASVGASAARGRRWIGPRDRSCGRRAGRVPPRRPLAAVPPCCPPREDALPVPVSRWRFGAGAGKERLGFCCGALSLRGRKCFQMGIQPPDVTIFPYLV